MQRIRSLNVVFSAAILYALASSAASGVAAAQSDMVRAIVNPRDSVAMVNGPTSGAEIPGNRIRLNVDGQISELPVSNLSQLLSGRFAGLQVLSPGATGMASRIRIRGQSSLLLDNEPLIVVDGVRLFESVRSTSAAIFSRVDDINVNEIATIDLLSGPAGTALYGGGGANGVVIITTKRGTAGKTRVSAYAEGGVITDPNEYPEQWALWGKLAGSTAPTRCTLLSVAAGACAVDTLTHSSVLNNDATTPIDQGYRNRYGAQISGGARRFQFFMAAEREDETGIFKMPALEVQRLKAERGTNSIPENQIRPSALAHNNFRVNLSAQPFSGLSLDLSSGYVNGDTRKVLSEADLAGIWANAFGGPSAPAAKDERGVPLLGYWFYPAGDLMSQTNTQSIERFINTIAAEVRPLSWLSARASYAKDDANQNDQNFTRPNEGPIPGGSRERVGVGRNARYKSANAVLSASATATLKPNEWLSTVTTFGAQGIKTSFSEKSVFGWPISPINSNSAFAFESGNGRSNSYYVHESVTLRNRFFLTGGARRETPTYGIKFDASNYYNVGAAWLLSEQQFLRKYKSLNLLRVRSAYGVAGKLASVLDTDLFLAFEPLGTTSTARPVGAPEISTEFEAGFDVAIRSNTSQLSFTFYNKRTRDGLVRALVPPGIGSPPTAIIHGALIQNRGVEATMRQQLVDRSTFSASIDLTASSNRNRIIAFPYYSPPVFGGNRNTLRSMPGYPVFGFWSNTYTYSDGNRDGVITPGEMTYSDSATYLGPSFPKHELAFSPHVELLNHKLRFSAQIDSKWGFKKFNNTLRHQCQNAWSCQGVTDKTAPLDQQAAAVALSSAGVQSGFIEDGSFTRLREVSAALSLPTRWARALRASEWNLVLTGRNLGVATNYSGIDPESTESNSDAFADESFSTPPMRYLTVKMNFKF